MSPIIKSINFITGKSSAGICAYKYISIPIETFGGQPDRVNMVIIIYSTTENYAVSDTAPVIVNIVWSITAKLYIDGKKKLFFQDSPPCTSVIMYFLPTTQILAFYDIPLMETP